MCEPQCILLIGDSILIEGVAITLAAHSDATIRRLASTPEEIPGQVAASAPCLVVTEWDVETVAMLLQPNRLHAGLRIAAIDPGSGSLVLIQGRQQVARSMDELIELLLMTNMPEPLVPA